MILIGQQEEVVNKLQGEFTLLSSSLQRINIYRRDQVLCIDIEIELAYKKRESSILLRFVDVLEYSFLYRSHRYFYNVEIFKLLKTENIFYVSFDPVDEVEEISEDDQDYIKSTTIECYLK
jgi:hypothetical protein